MAWVTKDSVEQYDHTPEPPKEYTKKEKAQNWWHYHKFIVLGVVVAILVGGGFGGVLGMFLGVPVFACLQVLVKYLVDRRLRRRNMPTEAYCYVNRDRESQPPEQQS